ncbi:MAG: FAD:protein FMN transferase [Alistipes sp.]|nr:FAD:protein FMN transferase [Candidatus Minthomonas equi]
MHTLIEILFVHHDRQKAEAIAGGVEQMIREEEEVFSRHLPESPVAGLNMAVGSMKVGETLYFALELCEAMRKETKGYFDIAALSSFGERPAYKCIPSNHSVVRNSPEVMLDFGGYAKGYALEKARQMLSEAAENSALLNFGNSSVAAVGTHPFGEHWCISPQRNPEMVIHLRDSALSISGNGLSGKSHIVNPIDGKTAVKNYDLGVTGKSALLCEILSTALYAAPESEYEKILASFSGYEAVKVY